MEQKNNPLDETYLDVVGVDTVCQQEELVWAMLRVSSPASAMEFFAKIADKNLQLQKSPEVATILKSNFGMGVFL